MEGRDLLRANDEINACLLQLSMRLTIKVLHIEGDQLVGIVTSKRSESWSVYLIHKIVLKMSALTASLLPAV